MHDQKTVFIDLFCNPLLDFSQSTFCTPLFPHLFAMKWRDWVPFLVFFWMLSFKPAFSLSFFTLIKRLFSSSLLSANRVVSSAYLRLLIFLLAILIPACESLIKHLKYINWFRSPRNSWTLSFAIFFYHSHFTNKEVQEGQVACQKSHWGYTELGFEPSWSGCRTHT